VRSELEILPLKVQASAPLPEQNIGNNLPENPEEGSSDDGITTIRSENKRQKKPAKDVKRRGTRI